MLTLEGTTQTVEIESRMLLKQDGHYALYRDRRDQTEGDPLPLWELPGGIVQTGQTTSDAANLGFRKLTEAGEVEMGIGNIVKQLVRTGPEGAPILSMLVIHDAILRDAYGVLIKSGVEFVWVRPEIIVQDMGRVWPMSADTFAIFEDLISEI